ncbi:GNAT family N-acetyltransferase [Streptomyces sp. NPDC086010]|uniref:GNAT family N-acetyltransferase n=1 Tax=Streptomyces sp. NPDC086010 TaxID=3365745 RepID=UPI0037CDF461
MAAERAAVDIRDDRESGRLVASLDGVAAGVVAYFLMDPGPGALVAVHTVVEPQYEGRGIGSALVREFYSMAAREGVPVVPLCPYAAEWARRHPEQAPQVSQELVRSAGLQLGAHRELF